MNDEKNVIVDNDEKIEVIPSKVIFEKYHSSGIIGMVIGYNRKESDKMGGNGVVEIETTAGIVKIPVKDINWVINCLAEISKIHKRG